MAYMLSMGSWQRMGCRYRRLSLITKHKLYSMKAQNLIFPHPGRILREEFLQELGVSQYRLGKDTGIPHSRITSIIKGTRSVSPDTALRLARYFGTSADFWLGLQNEYDLRRVRLESGKQIEAEVHPLEMTA